MTNNIIVYNKHGSFTKRTFFVVTQFYLLENVNYNS